MPAPSRRPYYKAKNTSTNQVVDVDNYWKQFHDLDDEVELSTGEEFRRGWRAMYKGKAEEASSSKLTSARGSRRQSSPISVSQPHPHKRPSIIAPSSPDLMFVDSKDRRDDVRDHDDHDYGVASGSTTLKRSRSPSANSEPHHIRRKSHSKGKKPIISNQSAKISHVQPDSEIIELSDEEVQILITYNPPAKRPRYTPSTPPHKSSAIEFSSDSELGNRTMDCDDDDDDDWDHPGLDLNDPDVWLPIPNKPNKFDVIQEEEIVEETDKVESITSTVNALSMSKSRYSNRPWPGTSRLLRSPSPPPPEPLYIWDKLRLAENLRFRPRPQPMALEFPTKVFLRPKHIDFNLHRLKATHSFKEAPGTINVIEQKRGLTAIGSACTGGLADVPNEIPSPYNRPGSLMVRSEGKLHTLDGHKIRRRGLPERIKYYTVNDVKFNPTSNSFASAGEDKRVRIWIEAEETDAGEKSWKLDIKRDYDQVPHALAFRPRSSILAVAEKSVHVYHLFEEYLSEFTFVFHKFKKTPSCVGSIAWGYESTADLLFASTEPREPTFTGAHKAIDVPTEKEAYKLDTEEAGDAMAIDLEGSTLALCTQAGTNKHMLRLYDIRRREPTARVSVTLMPFTRGGDGGDKGSEGEMNVVAFSPESLYLALARNDNHTHVYDRRMIRSGDVPAEPLFDYEHHGDSKAASENELYGVVNAQWLQSSLARRTCLVTGGEDGCVRMWDPSRAVRDDGNGKVIAEVDYDISQFSVGDPFVGDQRLIVGDASGQVTIFNNMPSF